MSKVTKVVVAKRRNRRKRKVGDNVKRYVKRALKTGVEVKRLDTISTSFSPTATGTITYFSGVAEGSDSYQRIGKSIRPRSFRLMVRAMSVLSTNNIDNANLRIIVFQYRQSSQTGSMGIPVAQDVIRDSNAAPATDYQSGLAMNNRNALHILFDKVFPVTGGPGNTVATSVTYQDTLALDIRIPQKRFLKKISYIGTTGAQNNSGMNALYVLWIASSANMLVEYSGQLEYTDE